MAREINGTNGIIETGEMSIHVFSRKRPTHPDSLSPSGSLIWAKK